jgi:hypothetical protein
MRSWVGEKKTPLRSGFGDGVDIAPASIAAAVTYFDCPYILASLSLNRGVKRFCAPAARTGHRSVAQPQRA